MLGLGETREELLDTLADLLDAGCDFLTLGQYLQPTLAHLPVERYVPPEEFDELGRAARATRLPPRGQRAVGPFELSCPRDGGILTGQEFADRRRKRAEMGIHDLPNQIQINAKIVVDEHIAHARDLLPRNFRFAGCRGG